MLFCNVTSFSKKAEASLLNDSSQVVLAVETHLKAWQELQASQRFRQKGWRTFWATAEESPNSEAGTWGGAFAAVRHYFQVQPLAGWREVDDYPWCYRAFDGFQCSYSSGVQVAIKDRDIMFLAGYHRGGLSEEVLHAWARVTRGGQLPFVAAADWNCTAQEVKDSGWPDLLNAEVVMPGGIPCAASSEGSTIDFLLVSKSALSMPLSLSVDWQVVWSPHGGLRFILDTQPSALRTRTVAKPRNLPIVPQEVFDTKEAADAWPFAVKEASVRISRRPEARMWHKVDLEMWQWHLAHELWITGLAGMDWSDQSTHRFLGRGGPPKFRMASIFDDRQGPPKQIRVQASLSPVAREADTLTVIVRRLLKKAASEIWR